MPTYESSELYLAAPVFVVVFNPTHPHPPTLHTHPPYTHHPTHHPTLHTHTPWNPLPQRFSMDILMVRECVGNVWKAVPCCLESPGQNVLFSSDLPHHHRSLLSLRPAAGVYKSTDLDQLYKLCSFWVPVNVSLATFDHIYNTLRLHG